MRKTLIAAVLLGMPGVLWAGLPEVVTATMVPQGATWRFDVTIAHADTGWAHYADGWGIYTVAGKELGYRVLVHPHVEEQPFTRSLTDVKIPAGIDKVIIRPRDSLHGLGPDFVLVLP